MIYWFQTSSIFYFSLKGLAEIMSENFDLIEVSNQLESISLKDSDNENDEIKMIEVEISSTEDDNENKVFWDDLLKLTQGGTQFYIISDGANEEILSEFDIPKDYEKSGEFIFHYYTMKICSVKSNILCSVKYRRYYCI